MSRSVWAMDPEDYKGTHRFFTEPVFEIGTEDVTLAPLLVAERWVADTDHNPKHYAVPGAPYVTWINGERVTR